MPNSVSNLKLWLPCVPFFIYCIMLYQIRCFDLCVGVVGVLFWFCISSHMEDDIYYDLEKKNTSTYCVVIVVVIEVVLEVDTVRLPQTQSKFLLK